MGVILFDTSVLIDHLRKSVAARQAWEGAENAAHEIAASVVTKAEVLAGMRSPERQATRALMSRMHWVNVSEEIAELAGTFARQYQASHQGIRIPDFLIAATAHQIDARLWTRNPGHFPMFPGLQAPY
jgi:predicted nucleic acid-binding protein